MITETMVVDAVKSLHGRESTMTQTMRPGEADPTSTVIANSLPPGQFVRALLARYSLGDAEAVVRWLEHGGYVTLFRIRSGCAAAAYLVDRQGDQPGGARAP